MGGGKHNKGCCGECIVGEDNFNRADGSLGPDWTASGTAAIDGNTAKITSGTIKYAQGVVDPLGSFIVTFETIDSVDGDIYDFFVWDASGTVLLTARFEADGTSGNWIISLRQGAGAWYSDNVEMISGCGTYQEPFLSGREFTISYDRTNFRVGGTTPTQPHYELSQCYDVGADVAKVGFGHGGGPIPISIDNFILSDHYVHNHDCPYPGCLCGNGGSHCWPDTFSLQLTNPGDCYVQLPSTSTIALNKVYRSQTLWVSDKVLPCYGCTTETTFYVQFFFRCLFAPGQPGFELLWCFGYSDTTTECAACTTIGDLTLGVWDFVSRDADCDPFDMVFEYGTWDTPCSKAVDDCDFGFPTCANLTAEITE